MAKLLQVRMNKQGEALVRKKHPWVMVHGIEADSSLVISDPGELATVTTRTGEYLATGYYNRNSHIAVRLLTWNPKEAIDETFFHRLFSDALLARTTRFDAPYYRLIHSEGDAVPGLVVDRYGSVLVCQVSTAGMERLMPVWLPVLEKLLSPETIVLRNDIPAREKEGLKQEVRVIKGEVNGPVLVKEEGTLFEANVLSGQKTGWFFDQRENHRFIASLAKDKTVLDVYAHSGGFGIPAARAGAKHVLMVDSSGLALSLAQKNAALNNVSERCETLQGKAYEVLEQLAAEGKKYNIVVLDPPAFVKNRKDKAAGLKGYQKLARLGAPLVKEGGVLLEASCSHHATRAEFFRAVQTGVAQAGRQADVMRKLGASPDHPTHPMLPENDYLKAIVLRVH